MSYVFKISEYANTRCFVYRGSTYSYSISMLPGIRLSCIKEFILIVFFKKFVSQEYET